MYDKDKIKGIREYREEQEAWEARKREREFDEGMAAYGPIALLLIVLCFLFAFLLW